MALYAAGHSQPGQRPGGLSQQREQPKGQPAQHGPPGGPVGQQLQPQGRFAGQQPFQPRQQGRRCNQRRPLGGGQGNAKRSAEEQRQALPAVAGQGIGQQPGAEAKEDRCRRDGRQGRKWQGRQGGRQRIIEPGLVGVNSGRADGLIRVLPGPHGPRRPPGEGEIGSGNPAGGHMPIGQQQAQQPNARRQDQPLPPRECLDAHPRPGEIFSPRSTGRTIADGSHQQSSITKPASSSGRLISRTATVASLSSGRSGRRRLTGVSKASSGKMT